MGLSVRVVSNELKLNWHWIILREKELRRIYLFYILSLKKKMQTPQAEVKLRWELMCNCKCNVLVMATRCTCCYITCTHTHTFIHTHTRTLHPCCLWLPKTCYGSRNMTGAQLDASFSLYFSFSLCCSPCLSQRNMHTGMVHCLPKGCVCPFGCNFVCLCMSTFVCVWVMPQGSLLSPIAC